MLNEPCPDNHKQLQFGSGDYYLFCYSCGRRWILYGDRTSTHPEYFADITEKKKVGGDPMKCTGVYGKSGLRIREGD